MASLFLSRRFSHLTNLQHRLRRNLSSFNNNRTKTGVIALTYDDDFNLWSETNWSQLNKQLNNSTKFPLPGQVGIADSNKKNYLNQQQQQQLNSKLNYQDSLKKKQEEEYSKQFDLFYRPLPTDHQMNTLMQINNTINYENDAEKSDEASKQSINKNLLELKAYECPVSLARDFQNYFPTTNNPLTVITVSLKTENDMSTYNNAVEEEREVLMKQFVDMAQDLCVKIKREGHWVDFIDPSSGRPYMGPFTHVTFYETDERYRELGFEIIDYGCCKVISHHKWGTKAYVGCVITTAPKKSSFIQNLISSFQ